jgi:hypothetical protein
VDNSGNPDKGDLGAAGYVIATVDGVNRQVCVTEFKTGGVTGTVFPFHIHQAAAGRNGPIVVDSCPC